MESLGFRGCRTKALLTLKILDAPEHLNPKPLNPDIVRPTL